MNRPRIGILDDWNGFAEASELLTPLRAVGDVVVYRDRPSSTVLSNRLAELDVAILWRERSGITADVLVRPSKLRLISQTGAPGTHLDLDVLHAHGVALASTPKASDKNMTAEFTIALVLNVAHAVSWADRRMRAGAWTPITTEGVQGRVLGVLGYGQVGSKVTALGAALGMDVRVWSRSLDAGVSLAANVSSHSLDDVLATADYLTVQLRLSPETRHFLDHQRLSAMKPGAFVINTARAGLIDMQALVSCLDSGALRGAALDVYDQEPLPPEHPLRSNDKVVLTPHLGWTSRVVQQRLLADAVDNVLAFLEGQPRNLVTFGSRAKEHR